LKKFCVIFTVYAILMLTLPFIFSLAQKDDKGNTPFTEAWGDTLKVYNHKTGKVMLLSSFDYVVGVVAAEVPASYEKEALKANAVAAYTYAMRKKEYKQSHPDYASDAHGIADVCSNYAHCKSYKNEAEQKEIWGDEYEKNRERIASCVKEVYGQMLLYDGEPALTVFYSISAGKTAACADIWGNEVPYLQSGDSSWDKNEKGCLTQVKFTEAEMKDILSECKLPEDPKKWLVVTERAASGYVKKVTVGDKSFSGGEMRKMFSLRSNCFEIEYRQGEFIFTVKGYGHGVGMSQSGSQAMALEGKSYMQILEHYYPGTVIAESYSPNEISASSLD